MAILLLLLVVLLITYGQKVTILEVQLFSIKYVRIFGQFKNLNKQRITKLLKPVVNTGFFSADLQTMQLSVEAIAWVDKAEIERVWPDTIAIHVYEEQAVARWLQESLLNKRGEVFTPKNAEIFSNLPHINGSKGQAHKLFKSMKTMVAELEAKNLGLVKLQVSERMSWQITLSNAMKLQLGRAEPMQKFLLFLKMLPILGEDKWALIKAVDMRYPNGFSVLWKSEAPLDWGQQNPGKVSG